MVSACHDDVDTTPQVAEQEVPCCLGRRSGWARTVSAESGNTPRMRIEGEPAHHLSGVVLNLTAAEAAELRDTLDGTLAKEPDAPGMST